MLRKLFFLLLLSSSLIFHIGCTSSGSGDEAAETTEAAEIADEIGDENFAEEDFADEGGEVAELEDGEEEPGDEVGDEVADLGDEEFSEGEEFNDGEEAPTEEVAGLEESEGANEEALDAETASNGEEGDAANEFALNDEAPAEPEMNDTAAAVEEAPVEPNMDENMGENMGDTAMAGEEFASPVKTWVPVKKIADMPYTKNGVLVNAVYIGRQGDTMEAVSTKIYGSPDRVNELLAVNTTLHNGIKTGDKIYYNSPQRPNDDSKLITFYEDLGLQPETYVSKPGENIRDISKNLLGESGSWKEVYATNMDVDSKGELPEGTSLRYWASSDVAVSQPPVEEMPSPEPEMPAPPEPQDMASNEMPPPPAPPGGQDMASNQEMPPPPAPPGGQDIASNEMPPPPPSMGSVEPPMPPPPPAPPKMNKRKKRSQAAATVDADQTMALGAAAILLLAAIALIIVIRKKKARKTLSDFANTQTHTQIE